MTTISVSSAAQLTSALGVAQAGDTISLASGNYGDFTIKNKAFSSDVTITSQNASSPAVFHSLTISASSHIHVDNVNVNLTPTATTYSFSTAVLITGSSSITLSHGSVTGGNAINGVAPTATALDSTGNVLGLPTGSGVSIQKSTGVTVDHMDISHLNSGLGMGSSDHITITNNDIYDLRRTAIAGGGVSDVTIDSNHLHDSNPWRWGQTPIGDHADFIAFWTDPTAQTTASNNIVVTNNLMEQGAGTPVLGVWFEGQYGSLGFTNVKVEANTILDGNAQAVVMKWVNGGVVDHNTLLQTSGDAKTAPAIMLTENTQHVVVSDNITASVSDTSGSTGSAANTISHNQYVQVVDSTAAGFYASGLLKDVAAAADGQAAFALAQKSIHGGLGDILLAQGGGGEVLTASSIAHTLVGGAGADTLISGSGNNVFTGGGGNDVFRFGTSAGHDTVTDFGDHDILDLSALLNSSLKPTITNVGGDVNISFANGEVITLTGIHSGDLISTPVGYSINGAVRSPTPVADAQVVGDISTLLRIDPLSGAGATLAAKLTTQLLSGLLTTDGAVQTLIQEGMGTSSVASLTYEFFTGKAPTAGGMDYLIAPQGVNANNLNAAYYQDFSLENRYINFSVNLGKVGEGAASFAAHYGGETLFDATRQAYETIFGSTPTDAKVHALLDPVLQLGSVNMTRADYFAYYGQDGADGMGTKAAMVGWLLGEAAKADVGVYALSNDAYFADIAQHGAPFGVDFVSVYGKAEFVV